MSLGELWDLVQDTAADSESVDETSISVASIGYERFGSSSEFAETLKRSGIRRLIDVRELPISRKRGFAKSALAETLQAYGIEYIHEKGLGNPKQFRDLYKAGHTERGRAGFFALLRDEHLDDLRRLVPLLESNNAALMCVEHETSVCHRDVIFAALRNQLGLNLAVTQLENES